MKDEKLFRKVQDKEFGEVILKKGDLVQVSIWHITWCAPLLRTYRLLKDTMPTAVILEILQSDNGSELLGKCIQYIKEFFKTVNIVKGKPHHPSEQGNVEWSNADFRTALQKWIAEYPEEKWPLFGAYVINAQINTRPMDNNAPRSEIYYGKQTAATASYI
jgi:hypothetical protein